MPDYVAERQELLGSAEPGLDAARQLSRLTDEAVRELARGASSHAVGRWAVVALGGWGAGTLLPASDIDILVLAEKAGAMRAFVERLLYPLWDAGLTVGHQVRAPKEQSRAMSGDLPTLTAALTARPIEGDVAWATNALGTAVHQVGKRAPRTLRSLRERDRPGSPYLLEPNLKKGRGGRRDWDELVWTAAVLDSTTAHDPEALVRHGLISPSELVALRQHNDTVSAARWELQRAGFGDLMSVEAADTLSVDPTAVQTALAETALALSRVREATAHQTQRSAPFPLSGPKLFEAFRSGPALFDTLAERAQEGGLDDLVGGFRELMTTRRPGLGHQFTVGAHCLKTALFVATIPEAGGEAAAHSLDDVARPDALLIAAMTHDAGKCEPGPGHAERGAPTARESACRFGLTEDDAKHAAELVRLHLVLAETALGADLDDEDTILATAALIGDRELLAPLHVLTAADSLATGPATWSQWRSALLGSLVARLDTALSDDIEGAGIAVRGESVRAAALGMLPRDARGEALRGFVERASLRYLAARSVDDVLSHAAAVADLADAAPLERLGLAVRPGPTPDSFELTIVAQDRPELFSRVAGALSLAGLDILSADAFGAPDGLALDVFVVASATLRPVEHATWAKLERLLRAALADRYQLRTRLDERRRLYPARGRAQTTVTVSPSGYDTAVRVSAPDRPGLLHDLSLAISESGFDIRWARVITVEGVAIDTFRVVDDDGAPVTDEGELGHMAMRLRAVG